MTLTFGINRIRLEFKVGTMPKNMNSSRVLIESDWNLKYNDADVRSVHMDVLIESDWNLKYSVFG